MLQVDLESLVCGGCSESKVACETILLRPEPDSHHADPNPDPDLPAESFIIPITDATIDWLDINPVYDRDDSTKGTSNPKSHHQKPLHTNSQRFSGNLKATAKAPIIGLPNKIQQSGYLGQSARKTYGRIFSQTAVTVSDPGSPKVSCFGRVLSERERNRRGSTEAAEVEKGGCWASLAAVFSCFGRREASGSAGEVDSGAGRNIPAKERKVAAAVEVDEAAERPGLVGMKRFVSGRRPASWGGGVEVDLDPNEDAHVAWSGPLARR